MVYLGTRFGLRLPACRFIHDRCASSSHQAPGAAVTSLLIRLFFGPVWWVAVALALLWSPFLIARLIDAPM